MFALLEGWEIWVVAGLIAIPLGLFGGVDMAIRLQHRRERRSAIRDKSRERSRR